MRTPTAALVALTAPAAFAQVIFQDPSADANALPGVPAEFRVTVFAREPLVRQTCSMAFDSRGRLFVSMGPQYRRPAPDTPGDSVVMVLDRDGDGAAEATQVFGTGFNCVQGMAWRGGDLYVANAPDLTVVRDRNGDGTADEYVRLYTDLGNLEHGLHGLNFAPDGRLWFSKGNSKGLNLPDRYAPRVLREMWGLPSPPGALDVPPPQTFTAAEYRRNYHDPDDDWGREGGVLRCDADGKNLELVAQGFRNPWDIAHDSGFHWLGTDNDQNEGDRVFAPFRGAHFGWNHPWAAGWTGRGQPHIAPVCGPLFQGSGTGVVFGDSPQFPARFRGVWFINDWLRKTTFVLRPQWDGARLTGGAGGWEEFIKGGTSLFRPVDMEFGPDGALWVLGWSRGYGAEYKDGQMTNEGRIYRIAWKDAPPVAVSPLRQGQPPAAATVEELLAEFDSPVPARRTDAQEELVRRGGAVREPLLAALRGRLSTAQETWTAWTLGRILPGEAALDAHFATTLTDEKATLNARLQSLRILAHRRVKPLPPAAVQALGQAEPRLRLEAVIALATTAQKQSLPALLALLERETDRAVFHASWRALRELSDTAEAKPLLRHATAGVRCGALLALLEDHLLPRAEVEPFATDEDPRVREVAALWLTKTSGGVVAPEIRGRALGALEPPAPAGLVRGLKARSGGNYESVPGGLRAGAKHFTDRDFKLKTVPADLEGCDFIRTPNADDGSTGADFLTFETLLPALVHVALDARTRPLPPWLADWKRGGEIEADHWRYQLYSREFPAGRVTLGGNTADGRAGGHSHYLIVLETLPLPPPAMPSSVEEVLALLPKADTARGAALFQQRGGAGCFACHQVNGQGNVFGPDLTGIGARADARHLVQSILEPNAVITEGFNLVIIETADATHSGVLLEESGLSVTLGLQTGARAVIEKPNIKRRETAPVSAMPPYAALLAPQHAADLTAWLLSLKPAR